ncbi:hypothetical protein J1N35_010799 [Gossypium stocksii]|uniref:DUF659 domain-containing protein n=1 Tax=Gossypium stocksii TaxID=47602 RepID=A0A9D3W0R9_9ROSI|nr:hypothetical protein J1N35_010799 [Gossypium stocksii]
MEGKRYSLVCNGWTDAQRQPLINFMAVSEGGVDFLKAINCENEHKDNFYMVILIKDIISEVEAQNVVQVITDNALVCKAMGSLAETQHPQIFWTPYVVHTLNFALKNICAAKNTQKNEVTYDVFCWINNVGDDAIFIRNFIMNHSMREDDVSKASLVKERTLDDLWWDKVDYILSFTGPIYYMLRIMDTDRPTLHLVYKMWDEMIEKVKKSIYRHEGKKGDERSIFYKVLYDILIN